MVQRILAEALLEDLDPYVPHPQITSYINPLDMFGGWDYQPGKVSRNGSGPPPPPRPFEDDTSCFSLLFRPPVLPRRSP